MKDIPPKVALVTVILLIAVTLFPLSYVLAQANWGTALVIEDIAGSNGVNPQIVLSGSNAVAAWRQNFDVDNDRVYSNYSTDVGITWHEAQLLSADTNIPRDDVDIAMSGSNVVAVWWESDVFGDWGFYSNYSTDMGVSWHTPTLIYHPSTLYWLNPQVAISGSNAVVIFGTGEKYAIYSCYSTDGGGTWSAPQLIGEEMTSDNPRITMSGSSVVAVWEQVVDSVNRIYSNYSSDSGVNWHTAQLIEDNAVEAKYPQVAISGSKVASVWQQGADWDYRVYSNQSADWGATWSGDQMIQNDTYAGFYPQVVLAGSRVVAAWLQADSDDWYGLYSNYSSDGGMNWNEDQEIAYEAENFWDCHSFDLAMSGSQVFLVWAMGDYWCEEHIYANYSSDWGRTWGENKLIEDNSDRIGQNPQVAAGSALAVWQQEDSSDSYNFSIYSNYCLIESDKTSTTAVGGEVYPINKPAIMAPWIGLVAAVIVGAYIFRKRGTARG